MKKYINATASMVMSNSGLNFIPDSAMIFVHTIKTKKNKPSELEPFRVYCSVNIVGTKDGNNPENPVDMKKIMQFKVRITKIDEDESKRLCFDISDFSVDCSNDALIDKDNNVKYIKTDTLIQANGLKDVPGKGRYCLRVLVKENTEDKYEVQSTSCFNIE